ncbi:MAG: hypothetical protein EOO77_22550 [Oxalobacteraceae bacterium]|nr:MAG: hypothetical protein EOO77_22550 [Oxalobacteraceae bacterium]
MDIKEHFITKLTQLSVECPESSEGIAIWRQCPDYKEWQSKVSDVLGEMMKLEDRTLTVAIFRNAMLKLRLPLDMGECKNMRVLVDNYKDLVMGPKRGPDRLDECLIRHFPEYA